jgi:hypothetical protein
MPPPLRHPTHLRSIPRPGPTRTWWWTTSCGARTSSPRCTSRRRSRATRRRAAPTRGGRSASWCRRRVGVGVGGTREGWRARQGPIGAPHGRFVWRRARLAAPPVHRAPPGAGLAPPPRPAPHLAPPPNTPPPKAPSAPRPSAAASFSSWTAPARCAASPWSTPRPRSSRACGCCGRATSSQSSRLTTSRRGGRVRLTRLRPALWLRVIQLCVGWLTTVPRPRPTAPPPRRPSPPVSPPFPEPLADATPESVAACSQWVMDSVRARGTTDIMAPLQRAVRFLQVGPRGAAAAFAGLFGTARPRSGCRSAGNGHAYAQMPAPAPANLPAPSLPDPAPLSSTPTPPDAGLPGRRAGPALRLPNHRRLRRERARHLPVGALDRGR